MCGFVSFFAHDILECLFFSNNKFIFVLVLKLSYESMVKNDYTIKAGMDIAT